MASLGFFSICKERWAREPEQPFCWLSVVSNWDRVGVHGIR